MEPLIYLDDWKSDRPKALQLYIDDGPLLVIMSGIDFHPNGLRKILDDHGIPFKTGDFLDVGRGH